MGLQKKAPDSTKRQRPGDAIKEREKAGSQRETGPIGKSQAVREVHF